MTVGIKPNVSAALLTGIEGHYGERLSGIYRVDRKDVLEDPDRCDLEIVVVLKDGVGSAMAEARELAHLTFDHLLQTGDYVRAWPVSDNEWSDPSRSRHPDLVREFKRHAGPVREAA